MWAWNTKTAEDDDDDGGRTASSVIYGVLSFVATPLMNTEFLWPLVVVMEAMCPHGHLVEGETHPFLATSSIVGSSKTFLRDTTSSDTAAAGSGACVVGSGA